MNPVLICGESYAEEIEDQTRGEGVRFSAILAEPMGRDTAAAAAIAAFWASRQEEEIQDDIIVVLLPSDHYIADISRFQQAILEAVKPALYGYISTIGILPSYPETGYGYISRHAEMISGLTSYPVNEFIEKPDIAKATEYFESGAYFWNSGMFAFRGASFLTELERFAPDIHNKALAAFKTAQSKSDTETSRIVHFQHNAFLTIPKKSIDYAVMEHTQRASVHPAEFGWSDVGSWAALHKVLDKDSNKNVLSGDISATDTSNSIIRSHKRRLEVTGLHDFAVIDTDDTLLICPLDRAQDVKKIHETLSRDGRSEALHHGPEASGYSNYVTQLAKNWLLDRALPFWSETGIDRKNTGAVESVSLTGTPLLHLNKRVRVQARQAYVFAHSSVMGIPFRQDALEITLGTLLENAQRPDGAFGHLLSPGCELIDDHVDLYDQAFVLLALAWGYKATGEKKLLSAAGSTLSYIKTRMRHPAGGYKENNRTEQRPRRANPHMHLLEAAMAWQELHGHEEMAELAAEMVSLFHQHFRVDGLLREFFNEDLSLISRPEGDELFAVEPGHLYEWSYLLKKYEGLTGEKSSAPALLVSFADKYGHNEENGLVLDRLQTDGTPYLHKSSRLWPQTECARYRFEYGNAKERKQAYAVIDAMLKQFMTIKGDMPGYWTDAPVNEIDMTTGRSPASSLYHIFGCLEPLLR